MASKGAAFDLAVGWWNLSTIYLFRSLLGWIALTCDDLFSLFSLLTSNGSSSKTQLSVSCCICWTDVVSSLTRISEGSKKYHFLPLMIKTHAFTQMSLVQLSEWYAWLRVERASIIKVIICKFPSSWWQIFEKLPRVKFLRIENSYDCVVIEGYWTRTKKSYWELLFH